MHAAPLRLNRIEGLAFEVEMALAKCCRVCPPSRPRELVDILKLFRERKVSAAPKGFALRTRLSEDFGRATKRTRREAVQHRGCAPRKKGSRWRIYFQRHGAGAGAAPYVASGGSGVTGRSSEFWGDMFVKNFADRKGHDHLARFLKKPPDFC